MRYLALFGRFCVVSVLALSLGCDKATLTAPGGAVLSLSASPTVIAAQGGTSTITIYGVKSTGEPLNPGTEIRLTTSLGTIDSFTATNAQGVATATLRSDGIPGTATVSATSGQVTTPATVQVTVGINPTSLTLQATPASLPAGGGSTALLAVVRNAGGPVQGVGVTFETPAGRLDSGGRILYTNGRGEVTDRLRVNASDLTVVNDTIVVKARAIKTDGSTLEASFTVRVE